MVIAGHNGAGKSTCYRKYLCGTLGEHIQEHIDPDEVEREIRADLAGTPLSDKGFSRLAQVEAEKLRKMYLENGISFSMETVFSDPVGNKLHFLEEAVSRGYFVVLLGVGLDSPEKSQARVALRVSRGGHGVPPEKIIGRYPRVSRNLSKGVLVASLALVVDNSEDEFEEEDGDAYYAIALFSGGELLDSVADIPDWWCLAYGTNAI